MRAIRYFALSLAVVAVDQAVKVAVKVQMHIGDGYPMLGDYLRLYFLENEGAAFGTTLDSLLSNVGLALSPEVGKLILSLFSIAAAGGIGYMLYRLAWHRSPLPWFLALIFGGALGNIIDRTFYGLWFAGINNYPGGFLHGRVVDMLALGWPLPAPGWLQHLPWSGAICPFNAQDDCFLSIFPIFNVADAAISLGIVVILLFQGLFFNMDTKRKGAEAPAPPASVPEPHEEAEKPFIHNPDK